MTTEARNTTTETETEIITEAEIETGQQKNIREGRVPAHVTEDGVQENPGAAAEVGQENTQDSEETGVRVTRVRGLRGIRVGLE